MASKQMHRPSPRAGISATSEKQNAVKADANYIVEKIEELQRQGDLYTKKIEIERRRNEDVDMKIMVRMRTIDSFHVVEIEESTRRDEEKAR